MKIIGPEGSIQLQKGKRGLSYRPEFKDWVKEHPGVMKQVAGLIEKFVRDIPEWREEHHEGSVSEGEITVTYNSRPFSDTFKVTIGKDSFFIKRDQMRIHGITLVGGQSEYYASVIAREGLKDDPDIEVINFQLGYTNTSPKSQIAYFVSKWEDLKTVTEYLNNPNLKLEERQEIENKVSKARRLFFEYHDMNTDNMFYDPKTKKIKVFDLNNINPDF